MFLPVAVGSLLFLFILGPLYSHRFLPPKWVLVVGELLVLAGEVVFSQNDADTVYWRLSFRGFILVAKGIACYFINFLNIVLSSSPPEEQGLVSGILQTVAQVSIAIAFAVGSSLVTSTEQAALLADYRNSFYFCIACIGLAALVALVILKPVDRTVEVKDDTDEEVGRAKGAEEVN
jgi:protein-S-isoprenylcysteine O-methyltransferase Ste14